MMRIAERSFATPGSLGPQERSKGPTSDEQYALLKGAFQSNVVGEGPQTSRRRSLRRRRRYTASVYTALTRTRENVEDRWLGARYPSARSSENFGRRDCLFCRKIQEMVLVFIMVVSDEASSVARRGDKERKGCRGYERASR